MNRQTANGMCCASLARARPVMRANGGAAGPGPPGDPHHGSHIQTRSKEKDMSTGVIRISAALFALALLLGVAGLYAQPTQAVLTVDLKPTRASVPSARGGTGVDGETTGPRLTSLETMSMTALPISKVN